MREGKKNSLSAGIFFPGKKNPGFPGILFPVILPPGIFSPLESGGYFFKTYGGSGRESREGIPSRKLASILCTLGSN